ncbi:MAG: autotransporter domain-containing protein [Rhodobacteraceae bacterium]|nr:autotransporter domain-containing protein [Paracoccaceae bacterium]
MSPRPGFTGLIAIAASGLLAASATGADFAITTDTVATNGGFILGPGDTLTVNTGITVNPGLNVIALTTASDASTITNNGFTITSGGAAGMVIGGTGSQGINFGTVTHTGPSGGGMISVGASAQMANNATITVTGANTFGMQLVGVDSAASNSGIVTASGNLAFAVFMAAGTAFTNSGIITASGANSAAIRTVGSNAEITNSGTISGVDTTTILLDGGGSLLTNTGTITATGLGQRAIFAFDPDIGSHRLDNYGTISSAAADAVRYAGSGTTVYNYGTISTGGGGASALRFGGSSNEVYVSGRLIAPLGRALLFESAENGLTLDTGAFIQGLMTLGASSFITINTGAANSFDFSFDGVPWWSMNVTGTVPHVVDAAGQRVASIDPTQFSAMQTGMTQTGDHVFGAIGGWSERVLPGGGHGVTVSTRSGPGRDTAGTPPRAWATGFGGAAWHGASGNDLAYATGQAGMVAGMDLSRRADRVFGIAAGGGQGRFGADGIFMHSHRIQTEAMFVAAYGAWQIGNAVLDVGLTGAMQSHDSQRAINNNLAPGGIDTGISAYSSRFIAPRVSVRRSFVLGSGGNIVLTTRAALGLTAGMVDAHTETASFGTASFAARSFTLGTGSADVELARSFGNTVITGRLGIVAETALGNETISGTLLGLPWAYDAGSGAGIGGQVGVKVDHRFAARIVGQIAAETSFGGAGLATTKGSASLRVEF